VPSAAPYSAASPATATPKSTPGEAALEAAQTCARAFLAKQPEAAVDCMADEAVGSVGGRELLVNLLHTASAVMKAKGIVIEAVDLEPPTRVASAGGKMFAVIRERIMLKMPDGHVRTNGYLLGVSADDGASWKFVDGNALQKSGTVSKLFPVFPPDLELPPPANPEHLP
jgi:hypothetical protein